ncbi:flagellar basal-body MS-ring/collar protein FliF [Novosphingobium sp. ZN18A2]|uniref:flagellar basal-body MS-ring/collar protein FliF n=1 Tax=Novosphingobium sp. ZN18A2 TaxID=3079861 RepID=UPI0030CBFA20
MADAISAGSALAPGAQQGSLIAPLADPAGGSAMKRLSAFVAQPPVRRALPWFAGVAAAGATALLWMTMAPAPQRMLYSDLSDSERAQVAAALDKAAIPYRIDNATGAVTVDEDQLYKARMVAASDGALATPETGEQMIDKLPLGASRTLEGERLRAARERELELTIMEIDGVEGLRVHLAEAAKSVFVRDNTPPTASVMVKLARGRQLSGSQVAAIVNLVAGSVPGLSLDAVKVIDQHGRLLSDGSGTDADRLDLQARMEEKLRNQVSALLTPMLGAGNFSSEIQVDLDMDQTTSARESYDKDGAVRTEAEAQSRTAGGQAAQGIPGVLSNTPPPATTAQPGPPQGTQPQAGQQAAKQPPLNTESSSKKTYELGREVAVKTQAPGTIKRLSVAVALSKAAMAKAKQTDIDQIKSLVSAAVGADTARGDQVAVAVRDFTPIDVEPVPFYEAPWFAMVVRNTVALLAVLLFLLLGVRPLIKALRRDPANVAKGSGNGGDDAKDPSRPAPDPITGAVDAALLHRQIGAAQRLVEEKPDHAVAALREMLQAQPQHEGAA